MADNWITIPAIVSHEVSTKDQWNKFVSNINLLKYPNSSYVKCSGTEADDVYPATSALLSFQSANLRTTMKWAGRPIFFAFKYEFNSSSASANDIDMYLCNDFNTEAILLANFRHDRLIDNTQITAGFRMHVFTSVPSTPTDVEWWIEMRNARNTGTAKTVRLKALSSPFLYVMEWP